jgi:hypothetical protein
VNEVSLRILAGLIAMGGAPAQFALALLESEGNAASVPIESTIDPEEIRRARARAKKARQRAAKSGDMSPGQDGDTVPLSPGHVPPCPRDMSPPVPGTIPARAETKTLSLSRELETKTRERETRVSPGHVPPVSSGQGGACKDGTRCVLIDDPIPPELVEAARMVPVQDIRGAWLKFCGYHAGQHVHVAGRWQKWCADEAKRERVERDRANRPRDAERPEEKAARERAEANERDRQRRKDAEHDVSQRNVVKGGQAAELARAALAALESGNVKAG